MPSAWRIVRAARARSAFSGEGAMRYGGRWSSPGLRIVYVSEHQSTAALEIFIHCAPFFVDEKYKAFRVEWPDNLTEHLSRRKWPANWRISPPPVDTMAIGDSWAKERRSVALALPSAISPDDTNFLLNPEHPDFRRVRIAPPIDYEFDVRLQGR